jgi:hypothetical protein
LLGGSDGTNLFRSSSGSGSLVSSSMAWYFGSGNDAFFKTDRSTLGVHGEAVYGFPAGEGGVVNFVVCVGHQLVLLVHVPVLIVRVEPCAPVRLVPIGATLEAAAEHS